MPKKLTHDVESPPDNDTRINVWAWGFLAAKGRRPTPDDLPTNVGVALGEVLAANIDYARKRFPALSCYALYSFVLQEHSMEYGRRPKCSYCAPTVNGGGKYSCKVACEHNQQWLLRDLK